MPKSNPAPANTGTDSMPEAIGRRVLEAVGRPANFQRLLVHRLWDNHYRVNIHVGDRGLTSRLAHSFFIAVDDDGAITSSAPAIERRYDAPHPPSTGTHHDEPPAAREH